MASLIKSKLSCAFNFAVLKHNKIDLSTAKM
nr:MAG TPA: hypothetical protein [Caudoviricetes sp.]